MDRRQRELDPAQRRAGRARRAAGAGSGAAAQAGQAARAASVIGATKRSRLWRKRGAVGGGGDDLDAPVAGGEVRVGGVAGRSLLEHELRSSRVVVGRPTVTASAAGRTTPAGGVGEVGGWRTPSSCARSALPAEGELRGAGAVEVLARDVAVRHDEAGEGAHGRDRQHDVRRRASARKAPPAISATRRPVEPVTAASRGRRSPRAPGGRSRRPRRRARPASAPRALAGLSGGAGQVDALAQRLVGGHGDGEARRGPGARGRAGASAAADRRKSRS